MWTKATLGVFNLHKIGVIYKWIFFWIPRQDAGSCNNRQHILSGSI